MAHTKVVKTDEEWRAELDPDRYAVLRRGATEPPFSGEYVDAKDDGTYNCAGCGAQLFDSTTKFESGSGWPSFWEAVDPSRVTLIEDRSHGMLRTEVRCANCGAHLGHLFPDGPQPTGDRYCMNSASLRLDPA